MQTFAEADSPERTRPDAKDNYKQIKLHLSAWDRVNHLLNSIVVMIELFKELNTNGQAFASPFNGNVSISHQTSLTRSNWKNTSFHWSFSLWSGTAFHLTLRRSTAGRHKGDNFSHDYHPLSVHLFLRQWILVLVSLRCSLSVAPSLKLTILKKEPRTLSLFKHR